MTTDRTITELSAMTPDMFLNPDNFKTLSDTWPQNVSYQTEQYQKGLAIGYESEYITISVSNVWGCQFKVSPAHPYGGSCSSYETIGYHAGTAALLRGMLDSGCPIKVYRYGSEDGKGYMRIIDTTINIKEPNPADDQSVNAYMYA